MTSTIYQIIIYFLYVSWISFLESWVKLWHVLMDEFGPTPVIKEEGSLIGNPTTRRNPITFQLFFKLKH
jgi:hypothetical protein